MANWISIKAAAEKYGTTEEVVRSLIRLRYINFSFVDDSELANLGNNVLMVDADSINKALELNIVNSLEEIPDDESIVRIPAADLKDLLRSNDEYKKLNDSLLNNLHTIQENEEKQHEMSKELGRLSSEIITLHLNTVQSVQEIIDREDEGFWTFLCRLFRFKK